MGRLTFNNCHKLLLLELGDAAGLQNMSKHFPNMADPIKFLGLFVLVVLVLINFYVSPSGIMFLATPLGWKNNHVYVFMFRVCVTLKFFPLVY